MQKIKYADYVVIQDIAMFNRFNNVIDLCDEGINLLEINTKDKEQPKYKMVITKHSDITLYAFVGKYKYEFDVPIKIEGDDVVCNVIQNILKCIENDIHFVKIYC